MNERPIGFIDSGVGGLSVVEELLQLLPAAPVVFVADNARCPYGNRTPEELRQFAFEMVDYLIEVHNIQMLIIACNTISVFVDEIREKLNIPVIDVLSNGAKVAAALTFTNHINVLGTYQTVHSNSYVHKLEQYHPHLTIDQYAAVEWVPMIEACTIDIKLLHKYLDQLNPDADCTILGCTHYPFILKELQAIAPNTAFINPAYQTIQEARPLINEDAKGQQLVFTTGVASEFAQKINYWLPERKLTVAHVELLKR